MDTVPPGPELPADPPFGFPENAAVEQCAMLEEMAGIAMAVARTLSRQIEAADWASPEDVASLTEVLRAARRSIALRNKVLADSRMTDEEHAAARARRDAAAAAAQLRTRKQAVRETLEDLIHADAAERGTPPGDIERLVHDMHERLLDADIARAFGVEDYSGIILGLCKLMQITPRKEIWSHRMMQTGISETARKVRAFQDGLKDPGAQAAKSKLPPTPAGLGNGPGPGGSYPKLGPFTFDETGAVLSVDPPDEPPSSWKVPPGRRPPDRG
jgi:hypothetical protein